MANLIYRESPYRWEPLQLMRDFWSLDGFPPERTAEFAPAFEVKETTSGYTFKADLPGVKEADLDIQLNGQTLTLRGKRNAEHKEEGERYHTVERSFGSFTRSFTLPEGIDGEHIAAELKEGVLTLVVPKVPERQPRRIALKTKS